MQMIMFSVITREDEIEDFIFFLNALPDKLWMVMIWVELYSSKTVVMAQSKI